MRSSPSPRSSGSSTPPVKHYSNGMYLRLAFAVAAHLEPDILLVDEVLAVGDARFQRKCVGKILDIADRQGRTVLVVSHDMGMIQRLCRRSMLLDRGQLVSMGPTPEIVASYLADAADDVRPAPNHGPNRCAASRDRRGSLCHGPVHEPQRRGWLPAVPRRTIEVVCEIDSDAHRTVPSFGVVFSDRNGAKLVNADILSTGDVLELEQGRNTVVLTVDQLHLNPGVYDVALWIGDTVGPGYDLLDPAFRVDVVAQETASFGVTRDRNTGA